MCPLYPLHILFMWAAFALLVWGGFGRALASSKAWLPSQGFRVRLLTDEVLKTLDVDQNVSKNVTFYIDDLPPDAIGDVVVEEDSSDGLDHLTFWPDAFPLLYDASSGKFEANQMTVSGKFLGFSKIKFRLVSTGEDQTEMTQLQPKIEEAVETVDVKVHRQRTTLDLVFLHVIILLVVITYVNMGCAIDISVIWENLRRPVAPAIGLASQYLFMPILSYGLGYLLLRSTPELWLGLFVTGCAPGGGASNIWTYLLGGSLDLSITMTFLSTLLAFAALPFWIWALGPSIFADGHFGHLPYRSIAMLVFGLVVPCGIGIAIRRFFPKVADFLKQMIKPFSLFFIVFIMTFGVYAKFYIFSFFSWRVALCGFCVPLAGFAFGGSMAAMLRRPWPEAIAISIETGIQHSGLAIGVIQIALDHLSPLDDIAIVVPVAISTMTPIPLLVCLMVKCIRDRRSCSCKGETEYVFEETSIQNAEGGEYVKGKAETSNGVAKDNNNTQALKDFKT